MSKQREAQRSEPWKGPPVSGPVGVCLYHDNQWRSRFQYFINHARKSIIPVRCLHRFQRFVCVCSRNTNDGITPPSDFNKTVAEFDIRCIRDEHVHRFMADLFKSELWNVADTRHRNTSAERLVYLLQCIRKENIALIENPEFKKQADEIEFSFVVGDFDFGILGLMIGKKGRSIAHLEKKYKSRITLSSAPNLGKRCITATIQPRGSDRPLFADVLKKALKSKASKLEEDRALHHKRQDEYYAQIGNRSTEKQFTLDAKATFTQTYERRLGYNEKHPDHDIKQKTVSKLEGGHCLNCLNTYSLELFQNATCTHHSGYTKPKPISRVSRHWEDVMYEWTCCGNITQTSNPDSKEHSINGCTVGVHNWRLFKRPLRNERRKKLNSLNHVDDSYVIL